MGIFMKKISILFICLGFAFIFAGCSSDKSESKAMPAAAGQSSAGEKKVSPNKNEVIGKVKLYDGIYFDDRRFGDHILKSYCEVEISNITDTSFDFTVYEVNNSDGEKNKEVIFRTNTAVFTGDGMKAAFYGNTYTLDFTFPNKHHAEPVVTDIEIAGFEPLEGRTYVNNGIPGHEFG